MTTYEFSQSNTEGYTDQELARLNAELAQRLANIAPDSDEYHETAKAFADEVSQR